MAGPFDSAADEVDARGAIYDRRLAARLLRFLAPYRKEVVLSVCLLAAISMLEIAGPYLTKVAIDTYVKPSSVPGTSIRVYSPRRRRKPRRCPVPTLS